jgi:hypothetical protein
MNMLLISTGIFYDKLRPQIVSVDPTAHAALAVTVESSMMNITRTLTSVGTNPTPAGYRYS